MALKERIEAIKAPAGDTDSALPLPVLDDGAGRSDTPRPVAFLCSTIIAGAGPVMLVSQGGP